MRMFVLFTPLLMVGALCPPAPTSASTVISRTAVAACNAPLTLLLRPGLVPGPGAQNGPAARDIPPNLIVTHLPLYPTAALSTGHVPLFNFQTLPPAYRKIAVIEFALPAGLRTAMGWYSRTMQVCGFAINRSGSFPRPGRPPLAALFFTSRDGLRSVSLTFLPISRNLTLVRYLVQVLDLPPRPAASVLHGPFVRVAVFYQSLGASQSMSHVYHFVIKWQPTIVQLVRSINRVTRIAVCCLSTGGAVVMTEWAVLSFVRADGGVRRVSVGGAIDRIVVGHTRPLEDTNFRVERFIDRLVHARCRPTHGCS